MQLVQSFKKRAAVAVVGKGRKGKYKGLEGPLWKTQKIGV